MAAAHDQHLYLIKDLFCCTKIIEAGWKECARRLENNPTDSLSCELWGSIADATSSFRYPQLRNLPIPDPKYSVVTVKDISYLNNRENFFAFVGVATAEYAVHVLSREEYSELHERHTQKRLRFMSLGPNWICTDCDRKFQLASWLSEDMEEQEREGYMRRKGNPSILYAEQKQILKTGKPIQVEGMWTGEGMRNFSRKGSTEASSLLHNRRWLVRNCQKRQASY